MGWIEAVSAALALAGSALIALAGVGLLRLPDPLTRATAVSKAAALGLILVLLGAVLEAREFRAVLLLVLILVAHLVTVSLSAIALARAAYSSGTARPPVTRIDEPAGRYEPE